MKDLINDAERELAKSERYQHQIIQACFRFDAPCLILPKEFERLESAKLCSGDRIPLKNGKWDYLDNDCCSLRESLAFVRQNDVVTQSPMPEGDNWRLMAVSDRKEDQKIEVTVTGRDTTGREIWWYGKPGEGLSLASNDAENPKAPEYSQWRFSQIDGVHKPRSKGYVYLYAYDPDTKEMVQLARYHPTETDPCYTVYRFDGCPRDTVEIVAQVIPRIHDKYFDHESLLISDFSAIRHMVWALDAERPKGEVDERQRRLSLAQYHRARAQEALDKWAQHKTSYEEATNPGIIFEATEYSPGRAMNWRKGMGRRRR